MGTFARATAPVTAGRARSAVENCKGALLLRRGLALVVHTEIEEC